MKVYGDGLSGNCYKIRLICALLDIAYEWQEIDILNKETHTSEFLKKNPNGKVPLLELDNGECLSESNAIINYLAFGSSYLPQEKLSFAKVQQWQFFEQYSHEPYIAVARFIKKYLGLPEDRRADFEATHEKGYKALAIMNEQLAGTNFIAGDDVTTADISLYAYTHVAHEGEFDLSGYPEILNWFKRIEGLEGYVQMAAK